MLAVLLAVAMLDLGVRPSKLGLALNAVRDDEDRARGSVYRPTGQGLAFSASAGLTAMSAACGLLHELHLPAFAVRPAAHLALVLMAFLGGRPTLWGPVSARSCSGPASSTSAYRFGGSQFYLVAYALFLLVIMPAAPGHLPTLPRPASARPGRGGPRRRRQRG